ncbi:sensor histidine kinase [Dokdonella fugitiva]|uniref:sensor histidine kinase n=1 Tax=Dokdonella fugitiva TaxID=328517 RepID=UPI0017AF9E09|nr:ATP-binding protein [Dokdonella fugitiva]MBA8882812.1 PAS domain S-box-containing protein [Dokdonella fugitiva]
MRLTTANVRFLALMGSLVLVVFVGWLVRQRASDETNESFRWLGHSQQVRATLYDLNAALAELQASAYATRLVPGDAAVRARYADAHARFEPLLAQLRELTIDNPSQQERIGFLRARLDAATAELDHIVDGQDPSALLARVAIGDITEDLLAEENRLALERQRHTDSRVAFAQFVTIATAIAQVLLLGAVLWAAEKQTARRIDAEAGARSAVGRARLIVESVREPIAVVDADLSLVQANRAFSEFYGIPSPEGAALEGIGGWGDAALLQRLRDVVGQRRELWDFETEQEDADGNRRRVIVNARAIDLPDTDRPAALLTVSDITARKHSEEQVLELNRQLSGKIEQVTEVNRELEAFSYSVSHDLRAPLRHIAGFADKLAAQLGDERDAKLAHYCAVIADSARRMSSLIEDLLAYSRLGRHALRLQPVDLQSLVEEVRSTLMSAVEDRRVQWQVAPLPVVIGDASMLRLAWQNLLDNALKYTAGREPAQIEIGCRDDGDAREFWVRDNGVGFDMKYADKLFGVFQRLHKASEFEGTGIGLASVRRIVARHGGRTWGEGEAGAGATIHFTLPRHESIRE